MLYRELDNRLLSFSNIILWLMSDLCDDKTLKLTLLNISL